MQGEEVIPAQFDSLYSFMTYQSGFYSDGYTVVCIDGQMGVIDDSGNYLINPQYEGLNGFTAPTVDIAW